ncbi:hypothetical protein C8J57DRAFT_1466718 [Mycena rebaudengoi]|nr:hypothetical protein C8J57DRAFT_1466718 [Mycena rebaudengoi]
MYLNNNDLCEFFNLLPARDLDPPKAARPLGLGVAFGVKEGRRGYLFRPPTTCQDQSLPLSTITIAHHIHIPPRRRFHIHSSLQTDMLTTGEHIYLERYRDPRARLRVQYQEWGHQAHVVRPIRSRLSRAQLYPRAPPVPGVQWKRSPYACVPLPDVVDPPPAHHQRPEAPRPVCMPVAQPPQTRMKPIALPPQLAGVSAVKLSPLLRCGAARWGSMPVDFSWPRSPTAASKPDERALSELATYPGFLTLTVISELLPWPITVRASGIRLRWVTVADVLGAIHEALSIYVDEQQFIDWVSYEGNEAQRRLRYRRGMTRLDLLGGQTRFAGLSESEMGCDIWVLNLA